MAAIIVPTAITGKQSPLTRHSGNNNALYILVTSFLSFVEKLLTLHFSPRVPMTLCLSPKLLLQKRWLVINSMGSYQKVSHSACQDVWSAVIKYILLILQTIFKAMELKQVRRLQKNGA